ncbi:MAG: vanadium-dependent haloperoxidase [Litoreibacter sp.]|nr:vanadium-dependent haloperoxidase [Litoreibacter sp.]
MSVYRRDSAFQARVSAAQNAKDRNHPEHEANGDEQKFATSHYLMSFTKGLDHDTATGLVDDPQAFMAFRQAIDDGFIDAFNNRVPVPMCEDGRRKWEAPTAGLAYDLQGPDCQAVTMAPAPALGSDELDFEMAEVYELALLRDEPLASFAGAGTGKVKASVDRLNKLAYAKADFPVRPRAKKAAKTLDAQTAFRGSSPGVTVGHYLSQFMWIGNGSNPATGEIAYGPQLVSQKVAAAEKKDDYMTDWAPWHEVQQGCDVNKSNGTSGGQKFTDTRRFICTPRDLATYVHVDALYQAYLNACLILLGQGAPFDSGFSHLSGMRKSFPTSGPLEPNAGGFALYGGPHILSLVTEVATRALKAARYQKFNLHIRARPEVLAARLEKASAIETAHPELCGILSDMAKDLDHTIKEIKDHNGHLNDGTKTALLPMAFAEGSPMHPAYAAGHATVAGACVTVLKAFFDTGAKLVERNKNGKVSIGFFGPDPDASDSFVQYAPNATGSELVKDTKLKCPLTLEGELNKLAANISIGRDMAGVHYFSDYYDSLRMGEQIAIGMLEEQALCYPTDPVVMSVQTFDGKSVRIGAR